MNLIDISKFGKFDSYSQEILDFSEQNGVKLPNLNSIRGQVLALMTATENLGKVADRTMLDQWANSIGMTSSDIVQAINKTSQWGLQSLTQDRKWYSIPFPFIYVDIHLKKRKFAKISGSRDEKINLTKQFLKENYLDVPNSKWEVGHLDPNSDDNSEENLIYQPPIQGRYRDRFKFDKLGITKYPTVKELESNFERYYSEEEIQMIAQVIKNRTQKK